MCGTRRDSRLKKIYVVGIGPGDRNQMTQRALDAIAESEVIVGYDCYVSLIGDLADNKEIYSSGMKREKERCAKAIEYALLGKTTAVISSGDAGVYGMAGIVYELAAKHPELEIEVVPGITAACSGAAVAGAPLVHDFAVISLSDLLTPWDKIEKRIRLTAQADFVICIYNPSSKKRADYLSKACGYMLEYKDKSTPCAYIENIGRDGERCTVCTLEELAHAKTNMFTTVIVGNSETKVINGKLVTPRGYKDI